MQDMKYYQVNENSTLPDLAHLAPFKAVLALEINCSDKLQNEIADWLVTSGCRYIMICGEGHEAWKDAIRKANLAQFDIDDMQSKDFVMVTPHVGEKLRNVFWHAKKVARHPDVAMNQVVTIHLSDQNRAAEYLTMYEKA